MIITYYLILTIAQSYDSITSISIPMEASEVCMSAGQQAAQDLHKNTVTSVQFSCVKAQK